MKKQIKAIRFGSHTLGWRWELPATDEAYEQIVKQIATLIPEAFPWEKQRADKILRTIGIKPQ